MGKGDTYIQRQQEVRQRANIMNSLINRPIDRDWLNLTDTRAAIDGQYKLANDLTRKRRHK